MDELLETEVIVMNRITKMSDRYRSMFAELSDVNQKAVMAAYAKWVAAPQASGLKFSQRWKNWREIRCGVDMRAVCYSGYKKYWIWDWVGTHNEFDNIVRQVPRWPAPPNPDDIAAAKTKNLIKRKNGP